MCFSKDNNSGNFILRDQIILLNMQSVTVDVLVCGGGMSGMACASFASQAGARVLVVEKQGTVGGSSNYSAGMLYVSLFNALFPSSCLGFH